MRSPWPKRSTAKSNAWCITCCAASPAALAATKRLLADVVEAPMDDVLLAATAKCIADARVSPEGREGIAAFLEKRAPSWAPKK